MEDQSNSANEKKQQAITGKIVKVFYSNPNGSVTMGRIEIKPDSYEGLELIQDEEVKERVELAASLRGSARTMGFKLFGPVVEGDLVKLVGEWKSNANYGPQFVAQSAIFDLPLDEDGLIRYISESPDFKGFGKTGTKATRLVTHFGLTDFNEKIKAATAEEIAKVSRISLEDAENFKKVWEKRASINAIATQLASYELTARQIEKIIEVWKDSALSILKSNPYALIGEIDGFSFSTVDKIAIKIGTKKDDPRRISAGVYFAILSQTEEGHTWTPRVDIFSEANKLLILDNRPEEAKELIHSGLDELINKGDIYQDREGRVAVKAIFLAEQLVGVVLSNLGAEENTSFVGVEPEFLAPLYNGLNEDQSKAVDMALSSRALCITGGAGTGKTTILARIIAAYEKIGKAQIAICAPTGKAAKRLEEVLAAAGMPRACSTLHRLLGYDGTRFNVPEIEAQLVIVDEFSMVDALLAAGLCSHLRAGSAIILVGDADQLPPVGAGNILRDILARQICPIARLTQVVRQAGPLRKNCLEILNGRVLPQEAKQEDGSLPWIVCNKVADAEDCQRYINVLVDQHVNRLGFDLLYETQILTAQKEGPVGVKALNKSLQTIYQRKRGVEITEIFSKPDPKQIDSSKAGDEKLKEHREFYAGDKVIYTRNNYELMVFNGDVGVIRSIEFKEGKQGDHKFYESITVAFGAKTETDGSLVKIPRGDISDLSLAYALTVHKAQGSEYPCVILVAHKSHSFMHNNQGRNWLYTGATRARKTLIIVGDQWGIANSAAHTAKEKRRTWLSFFKPVEKLPAAQEDYEGFDAEEEPEEGELN